MTDGLVAALFGLVICRLQRHFGPQCPNRLVFNLLSALAVGISITLCAFFLPELHADKILIGDIMLLIPGLAMTNAVRDTMVGSRSPAPCGSSKRCCGPGRWLWAS